MGRIKNCIFAVICLLVVSLSACGINTASSSEDADKTKEVQTVREEKKTEKKEEKKGDIPQGLRPSSEQTEEGQVSSDTMEIMGEDGTVQTFQAAQGGEQSASGNAGDSGASGSAGSSSSKGTIEISFTIESSNADGSVSYSATMTLNEGATVYDALAASGVSHSGKSYVTAIGGLSAGMFGGESGWKYYVNGSEPGTSCVNYTLQNGDYVQWSYVRTA